MATGKLVKMIGDAEWCAIGDGYEGRIVRAILREEKELVIDLNWGPSVYSVRLQRMTDDLFQGVWSRTDHGVSSSGTVRARLYTSSIGTLLLGEWSEENTRYKWWAEMRIVHHFPDENRSNGIQKH